MTFVLLGWALIFFCMSELWKQVSSKVDIAVKLNIYKSWNERNKLGCKHDLKKNFELWVLKIDVRYLPETFLHVFETTFYLLRF